MKSMCILQQVVAMERRLPSERILWDEIRDEVTAYFEQSQVSPWSIEDDVYGAQGLALNFFFPLRGDRRGLSRLLGLLCGRHLTVDAFELTCRGRTATHSPGVDVVVRMGDSHAEQSVLLVKCMPPLRDGAARATGGDDRPAAPPAAPSADEPVCDVRVPELARGQRLAEHLERRGTAERVALAVVYDNRDVSLADLCTFWRGTRAVDDRFHAWTYQQLLAMAGSMMADVPGWRAFLSHRYGITAIGAVRPHAAASTGVSDQCRSA